MFGSAGGSFAPKTRNIREHFLGTISVNRFGKQRSVQKEYYAGE